MKKVKKVYFLLLITLAITVFYSCAGIFRIGETIELTLEEIEDNNREYIKEIGESFVKMMKKHLKGDSIDPKSIMMIIKTVDPPEGIGEEIINTFEDEFNVILYNEADLTEVMIAQDELKYEISADSYDLYVQGDRLTNIIDAHQYLLFVVIKYPEPTYKYKIKDYPNRHGYKYMVKPEGRLMLLPERKSHIKVTGKKIKIPNPKRRYILVLENINLDFSYDLRPHAEQSFSGEITQFDRLDKAMYSRAVSNYFKKSLDPLIVLFREEDKPQKIYFYTKESIKKKSSDPYSVNPYDQFEFGSDKFNNCLRYAYVVVKVKK